MGFVEKIDEFKKSGKGLMSYTQYFHVGEVVNTLSPCNMLVFGLGEDSYLWDEINAGGRTVFLEDDQSWIEKFSKNIEIHRVEYHTRVEDHDKVGFDETQLEIDIHDTVRDTSWDLVLIDGPLSHNPPRAFKGPGRMSSIYEAHRLLRPGGIAIVDDIGRLVESKYAFHYFGGDNLWKVVEKKVAFFKKER